MSRILIVSNRLPVQISITKNEFDVQPSVGGLATGMKSVHGSANSEWIGWSGLNEDLLTHSLKVKEQRALKKENCIPVYLNEEEIEGFYSGFSNNTIWPLFHYFTEFTDFSELNWHHYKAVNKKFADVISKNLKKGDKLWIHDYHLLLLPSLIKEKHPDVLIGFFLHIPFPSFEVFRILPWRKTILEGMLGADLIGFHTYNYERHFLSSVRRLLGFDISLNEIHLHNRTVIADSFPMGVDYERFHKAALRQRQKSVKDKSEIVKSIEKHLLLTPDFKLILSIDRLDYTKGIANRLRAFEYFLEKYPEFREKVTLVMLVVPSRSSVDQYILMKKEVDELVGMINGKYSTINWNPVWYFYRALPFENLIDLYISSEVALLTPIRDGMNLVAKEYVAAKIDKKGVLILSEMAGAAQEMSEAIIINPNSNEEIADALHDALVMPENEQIKSMRIMQQRLKRYNVENWAADFLRAMNKVQSIQENYLSKKINPAIQQEILNKFKRAEKRILFLDYDGTLVGFKSKPEDAFPDQELIALLDALAANKKNKVVLISGRDRPFFDKWFKTKKFSLVVEHGVWFKHPGKKWEIYESRNTEWKELISSVLEFYVDRTPGTFIEEKNFSLVWHYRKADPELGTIRANELKDELSSLIANLDIEVLEGHKVIEVKNSGINKGRAASRLLINSKYDFVLGVGDDWTDEYLFKELPTNAITIRVGLKYTSALYNIESPETVRTLLTEFSKSD